MLNPSTDFMVNFIMNWFKALDYPIYPVDYAQKKSSRRESRLSFWKNCISEILFGKNHSPNVDLLLGDLLLSTMRSNGTLKLKRSLHLVEIFASLRFSSSRRRIDSFVLLSMAFMVYGGKLIGNKHFSTLCNHCDLGCEKVLCIQYSSDVLEKAVCKFQ